ncbi:MAG TPA: lysophospholipid acyltransferase family protein [Candidatus Thermoplasmatota archaeon]|nr:lysophospholipid acyltransferase family protein [Candidatus Thermoplasmatota archaeon]
MAVRRYERRVKLRRWAAEDWEYAHVSYRFIKATFHHPVRFVSRLNVRGAENMPATGPVILAVNHLSWADPVVVGAAIQRPAFYLAKEGVFHHPVTRWLVTATGQIKVDRHTGGNEGAVATATALLSHNLVVGIFPEGTRSRPGQVKRGKTGIARIAAASGAPIVPIGCDTGAFWPRGRTLPKLGEPVYIHIGAPLRLDLKPQDMSDKERMRHATDEVMDRVRELYLDAVRAREGGETWA